MFASGEKGGELDWEEDYRNLQFLYVEFYFS